jgi:hypothetical protein
MTPYATSLVLVLTVWGTHIIDNKIKNKTTKPQQNAAHLKTACQVRLVRGRFDGAPRPRSGSDSHEAPSTGTPRPHPRRGHLDHTPTRTRLVHPTVKTPTRVTPGQALDPLTSPTPGQKSEHLMRLPTTTNRYGHNQDRRGDNAGVSLHYFTAHPVMGGESCHCTHLTVHYSSPVTLEGGYDKARIQQSRGFSLIRPVSTRPRPNLDAQHSSTEKEGQHGTALRVISASHPLRHHGVRGWPSIPGTCRYSLLNRVRQNITSRLPGVLASSYPIKASARTQRRETDNRQDTR